MLGSPDVREEFNRCAQRTDTTELKDFARWGYMSAADWTELCRRSADFAGIADGDRLFEAGCGSGAFLAEVAAYRRVSLSGVDFAENLVAIASSRLSGDFQVADITDLSRIEDGRYDKVLSHGVFLYMDTPEAARRATLEMARITRPGGAIYVGIVNDPDRRASYDHPPSGSFVLPRSFWRDLADRQDLTLELVDQEQIFSKPSGYDAYSRLRYSLLLSKP
ncbi:MAG: class I SAM-dependent methyltransferase [Haliangium ochraceum]